MMGGGMVFCHIIGKVGFAWLPENCELLLVDTIPDPIETHIDGF